MGQSSHKERVISISMGQPFVVLNERQLANPDLVREFEGMGIEIIAQRNVPMTTDPDEGRRQIEAMQPTRLVVGDLVRLKAGGARVMTVVALEDYGNNAVCQWQTGMPGLEMAERESFPVRSLAKIGDHDADAGAGAPRPQGAGERPGEGNAEQDQGQKASRR